MPMNRLENVSLRFAEILESRMNRAALRDRNDAYENVLKGFGRDLDALAYSCMAWSINWILKHA